MAIALHVGAGLILRVGGDDTGFFGCGHALSFLRRGDTGLLVSAEASPLFSVALSFLLRGNASFRFGSTASLLFGLALSFLRGGDCCLVGSEARILVGPAFRLLRGGGAGFLFKSDPGLRFGLASSFLGCGDAGFRSGLTLTFLFGRDAAFFFDTAPGFLPLQPFGFFAALALRQSPPPQRAHDNHRDRGCERKGEPTDDQKHLHSWGRPLLLPRYCRAFPFTRATTARTLAASRVTPADGSWHGVEARFLDTS